MSCLVVLTHLRQHLFFRHHPPSDFALPLTIIITRMGVSPGWEPGLPRLYTGDERPYGGSTWLAIFLGDP